MAESRRAVVIGVDNYADKRLPALAGAVNDAKELREKLKEFGSFDIPDEHFLLDGDATCQNIRSAISDLLWKTDPCEVALFYFSGHGLQDGYKNGYIAPYDIIQDEPLVSGIRMNELRSIVVDAVGKRNVIVILDCCYSGVATRGQKAGLDVGDPVEDSFSTPSGQADGSGWIILASSGKDEKSRELSGCTHTFGNMSPHPHGLFSYYLLEGLDGHADTTNGQISLQQLKKYISDNMTSKQPKLSFRGAGVGEADQIIIATASEMGRVQVIIDAADEELKKKKAWAIFRAGNRAAKALKISPKLKAALDLRDRVDQCLAEYGSPINLWVLDHKGTIGESEEFKTLEEFAPQLSLDFIVTRTPQWQGLLLGLCQVTEGDLLEKTFLAQLSAVRQGRSAAPLEGGLSVK